MANDEVNVGARISAAQFVRIIRALEDRREDLVGEEGTDRELYIAWFEGIHTELVYGNERKAAQGAVSPDTNIVEVT